MSAVKKPRLISVEDYLAGELVSPVKHEYPGGEIEPELPLAEIYDGIQFAPEPEDEP